MNFAVCRVLHPQPSFPPQNSGIWGLRSPPGSLVPMTCAAKLRDAAVSSSLFAIADLFVVFCTLNPPSLPKTVASDVPHHLFIFIFMIRHR